MRNDFPDWLGKPPRRDSEAWTAWLEKWRAYARRELKDGTADDPDFDYGLLTDEERWRVVLGTEIRRHIEIGQAGGPCPFLRLRGITDTLHAAVVAWRVGRSVHSTEVDERTTQVDEWLAKHQKPRRREIAHAIRYGFLAGLGAEAAEAEIRTADYIAAYEGAWRIGNELAIAADPR